MSLIKKKDVKTYFSDRQRKGLHLVPPVANSPATEMQPIDSSIEANKSAFVEDFSLNHFSSGGTISAVIISETPKLAGEQEP